MIFLIVYTGYASNTVKVHFDILGTENQTENGIHLLNILTLNICVCQRYRSERSNKLCNYDHIG